MHNTSSLFLNLILSPYILCLVCGCLWKMVQHLEETDLTCWLEVTAKARCHKVLIHFILAARIFIYLPDFPGGMRSCSWLRHCATSRKVMGLIPDEVIGFFSWPNPSSCIMAMGSTQPLTEMSTRNLLGCKWWPACNADKLTAICELIV
jgi:hypothetical protein